LYVAGTSIASSEPEAKAPDDPLLELTPPPLRNRNILGDKVKATRKESQNERVEEQERRRWPGKNKIRKQSLPTRTHTPGESKGRTWLHHWHMRCLYLQLLTNRGQIFHHRMLDCARSNYHQVELFAQTAYLEHTVHICRHPRNWPSGVQHTFHTK